MKKGGSNLNSEQPFIRTEILFNSYLSMKKVVESIFSAYHRTKWDKNVLKYELIAGEKLP